MLTILSNDDDSFRVIDFFYFFFVFFIWQWLREVFKEGPVRRELDAEKYGMKFWESPLILGRM